MDELKDKEFFEAVLAGVKKATKKMLKKSALNDEDVIITDENGKTISVPAKELLKSHKL